MHILLKTTPCTGLIRNKRKIKIILKEKDSLEKQMLKDTKYFLKSKKKLSKKKL